MILRGAAGIWTVWATGQSRCKPKRMGGVTVMNRHIAASGENLGEGKTQEGLDR